MSFGKRGVQELPAPRREIAAEEPNERILWTEFLPLIPLDLLLKGGGILVGLAVFILWITPSPEQKLIAYAKERVLDRMIDPDSAKFSYVHVESRIIYKDPYVTVQGCVKGRNKFGGYTDWQGFMVPADSGNVDFSSTWCPRS